MGHRLKFTVTVAYDLGFSKSTPETLGNHGSGVSTVRLSEEEGWLVDLGA